MEMLQINDLLPEEQWEKYWTILGNQHEELPNDKEYVIFEHYCANPNCDCKSLVADIREIGSNGRAKIQPAAIVDYNWSSKKTFCTPTFHEHSPRTKIAKNLLTVYTKHIHSGEYLNKIKTEYNRVKILVSQQQSKQAINTKKNIGRNDPCHCGSNKKYKKCCLLKNESQII